jgi:hypothetical protein
MGSMDMTKILEDKYFKIKIKGDDWNIYKIDYEDNYTLDDDSLAETTFENKEIHFKDTSLRIVRHELLHVFISYTYTDTANLTPLQQEEMFCEMLGYELDNFISITNIIFNKLKEL